MRLFKMGIAIVVMVGAGIAWQGTPPPTAQGTTPVPTWSMSGTVSGLEPGSVATVKTTGAKSATTQTSAGGAWTIANLPRGAYTVTARAPHYTMTPASVKRKISDHNISSVDFQATKIATPESKQKGAYKPI